MLGCRDENAALHQAGGVADSGYIPPNRFDSEAIKVHATETDTRACCARKDAHRYRSAAVETYSVETGRLSDCLFLNQMPDCKSLVIKSILPSQKIRLW
jgi:hypothetical protein